MFEIPMTLRGFLLTLLFTMSTLNFNTSAHAQNYNVLKECRTLSPALDDVHACLDNYLNIMDGNIAGITDFLAASLSGDALAGLKRSQQAFVEYRRQNCLWYLDFSSPRADAEQIAKNCLASMSQKRLSELQALVSVEDKSGQALRGFYVYGPGRNSFQQCGSKERFWLEGDTTLVSRAQQLYLSVATSELQVLYGVFAGTIDKQAQAPAEHQGVLEISTLIDLRVPTEADCRLPGDAVLSVPGAALSEGQGGTGPEAPDDEEAVEQEEPEQQLIAYFGAWLVDCTETAGDRVCNLEVQFEENKAGSPSPAKVKINRQNKQATRLEVVFFDREIDSPSRIRWTVDTMEFGDIVGSEIRVDESDTRQLVPDGKFLNDELLPMMIKGTTLYIEVLESVDDFVGEELEATLRGLTKALAFSDEFVREG